MTVATSPLAAHGQSAQVALTLREWPFRGHLNLRGQPDEAAFVQAVQAAAGAALPLTPNTVATGNDVTALWLGPDEWLLVTAPEGQRELEQALNDKLDDLFAAVTDVSSYYTTIEVAGSAAADLLARGTALDLHPRAFHTGACAQTLLAKTAATIVKTADTPVFEVIVRVSFADYLWRWLQDGAAVMAAADA